MGFCMRWSRPEAGSKLALPPRPPERSGKEMEREKKSFRNVYEQRILSMFLVLGCFVSGLPRNLPNSPGVPRSLELLRLGFECY